MVILCLIRGHYLFRIFESVIFVLCLLFDDCTSCNHEVISFVELGRLIDSYYF